jgi:head-tail adaptor
VIISAGRLNRAIRFERPVAAEGLMSAGKATWTPHVTVAAEMQEMLPSRAERIAEGISIASRPTRIRIRYRHDITSDMRIAVGSLSGPEDPVPADRRYLRITAPPVELGNREGLELLAIEDSTHGNPA